MKEVEGRFFGRTSGGSKCKSSLEEGVRMRWGRDARVLGL